MEVAADGDVVIHRGSGTIYADHAAISMAAQRAQLTGNVRLVDPLGSLLASDLVYDFGTGEGTGQKLDGMVGPFHIRASRFLLTHPIGRPATLVADDARVSSCELDHPEYLLSARRLELVPGQRLSARGAGISLFGARILSLPSASLSLNRKKKKNNAPLLPVVGVSAVAGPFTKTGFGFAAVSFGVGRLEIKLSRRLGVTGGLVLSDFLPGAVFTVYHRQEVPRLSSPRLTVDRLPELRIPLKESLDVAGGRMGIMTEAIAGQYQEELTRTAGSRVLLRGALLWRGRPAGSRLYGAIGLSGSLYSRTHYAMAGIQTGYQAVISRDFSARGGVVLNGVAGRTPFRFDRLEAPARLEAGLNDNGRAWGWSVLGSYDLRSRRIYDAQFTLARGLKCLRPSLTYLFQNRQLQFGITIPALEEAETEFQHEKAERAAAPISYTWADGESLPNWNP